MGGGGKPASAETGYPQLNFTPKGAQIRDIYQSRIRNFTSNGQYQHVNLRSMFVADTEDGKEFVELETYAVPGLERPTFHEAMKGAFPSDLHLRAGDRWGWRGLWLTEFSVGGQVPSSPRASTPDSAPPGPPIGSA